MLVGTTGSGKTTFARRHFDESAVFSSDEFRARLRDSGDPKTVEDDAFDALHAAVDGALAGARLAVVDATNVNPDRRLGWVALARRHRVPAVAIVLDIPPRVAAARNAARIDKRMSPDVLKSQRASFMRSLPLLLREGFANVYVLHSEEEIDAARVELIA